MKTLLLIRHAKSSWQQAQLADHERPLNRRGERNRWQMAERLAQQGVRVERVCSSSALRARLTAEAIAPAICSTPARLDPALYRFDAAALIPWLQALPAQLGSLALVGHNPALTELAHWLDPAAPANLPTCAVLELQLALGDWGALARDCGRQQRLWLAREG